MNVASIRRISRSADRLNSILYEPIGSQPALQLLQTDGGFVTPLRHDGQVVKVFQQSLIFPYGDDHRRLFAILINNVLPSGPAHLVLRRPRASSPFHLPLEHLFYHRRQASSSRSRSASTSPAMGTRTCSMLSRSRMVTALSSSVSKSMVTQ